MKYEFIKFLFVLPLIPWTWLHAMICESESKSLVGKTKVILIVGTACSGKSKIADELKRRLGNCLIIKNDSDDGARVVMNEDCVDANGWEAEHIYVFNELRSKILHNINKVLIAEICPVNCKGKELTAAFIEGLKHLDCEMFSIVVYCPLGLLMSRAFGKPQGAFALMNGFYIPQTLLLQFLAMYLPTEGQKIAALAPTQLDVFWDKLGEKDRLLMGMAYEDCMALVHGDDDCASIPLRAAYSDFDFVFHNDELCDSENNPKGVQYFTREMTTLTKRIRNWLIESLNPIEEEEKDF